MTISQSQKKQQGRLELIENNHVMDFEDPMFVNHNIVAENIAKDIAQEENRDGYFVESDDEPDAFPEQDFPEEVPDLPTSPPPGYTDETNNVVIISVNGETSEEQDVKISHTHQQRHGNTIEGVDDRQHDVIIPIKIERKVKIPINLTPQNENIGDQDSIIPEAVQRTFQFPTEFKENKVSLEANNRLDNFDDWISVTSLKLEPEPGKMAISLEIENSESPQEEVDEEIIEPVNAMKDHAKDLVKVISVVNALKKANQDKDPDIIDKIDKDIKDEKTKGFANAVTKLNISKQSTSNKMNVYEMSPPKEEKVISNRVEITVKPKDSKESPPPKSETLESEREVLKKPSPVLKAAQGDEHAHNTNVMKTSITVEKQKVDEIPKSEMTTGESTHKWSVPPLNLEALNGSSSDVGSPSSDRSVDISPSSKYKTTIDVPKSPKSKELLKAVENNHVSSSSEIIVNNKSDAKHETSIPAKEKASLASMPSVKPLSQIKPLSFNPKSLSQSGSRPVQYKTTISTLGMKPSSFAKNMPGSQKPEYPIKRMETMPFEVSILKGILGIGIKTTMTPEGHVKITEILPNGPVGREGNIQVGDYILSINSTELTGLTDAKVQQILRLLPRGLSKIVASAVPPSGQQDLPEVKHEPSTLTAAHSLPLATTSMPSTTGKPNLSPRQEQHVLSPRQPQSATSEQAPPLSPNKPSPVPRSNAAPLLPKSQPPVAAPRSLTILTSPRSPLVSPVSPNQLPTIASMPTKSLTGSPSLSPMPSPRKSDVAPPTLPQVPPPIAPKPKKPSPSLHKGGIESGPIDAEVFVSVNATNEMSPRSGVNILPGSVHYDTEDTTEKTGWIPGVVSSASLHKGKDGVVTDAPDNCEVHVPVTDILDVVDPVIYCETAMPSEDVPSKNENALEESTLEFADNHFDDTQSKDRSRSFSTSSSDSYKDFKECNVEDEIVPEQIAEEDTEHNNHEDIYEPDFEIEDTDETDQETNELKVMAQQIVENVISSIKKSDLLSEISPNEEVENKWEQPWDDKTELINADVLAVEDEIIQVNANDVEAPPLPQSPPPIPTIEVPHVNTEPQKELVDLSLYPDSDQGGDDNLRRTMEEEVIDRETVHVVESQTSSLLHVDSPCVVGTDGLLVMSENVINDLLPECEDNNGANYSSSQTISTIEDPEDESQETGDQSISNVISLYSNLEQSLEQDEQFNVKTENNNNYYKVQLQEEQVVYDTLASDNVEEFSNTSSRDIITDCVQNENTVTTDQTEETGTLLDLAVQQRQEKNIKQNSENVDINGDSGSSVVDLNESVELDSIASKDSADENVLDGTDSTETRRLSRVDQLLSEHETKETKYSPELDRMIKMMSTTEEPEFEGEGELLKVTLNKGVTGLGFLIQGGRFTPKGDMPLTIKKVFKGGPADGILQVHDEICLINGEDISDMRHTEAWNHLKFLPSGDLTLTIRRYSIADETDV